MTREDRESEINDYVSYLDALAARLFERAPAGEVRVTVLGFSQGAATATRWVALGRAPAHRLVCWGGALAHDVALGAGGAGLRGARLTLVAGTRDELATPDAVAAEQERLRALGVPFDVLEYDGGHHIDAATLAALAPRVSAPERAFVAGATGYTGRAVVRALAARGVSAVAHVRPDSPRLADWRARFAGAAEVDATPWDAAALAGHARAPPPGRGVRAARHHARPRGPRGDRRPVRDGGLRADAAAARRRARVRGAAAIRVPVGRRGWGRGRAAATWPCAGASSRSCARAGLPYVIARPSFITGPDREEHRPAERAAPRPPTCCSAPRGALGARAGCATATARSPRRARGRPRAARARTRRDGRGGRDRGAPRLAARSAAAAVAEPLEVAAVALRGPPLSSYTNPADARRICSDTRSRRARLSAVSS
jgi:hypothetical protein